MVAHDDQHGNQQRYADNRPHDLPVCQAQIFGGVDAINHNQTQTIEQADHRQHDLICVGRPDRECDVCDGKHADECSHQIRRELW